MQCASRLRCFGRRYLIDVIRTIKDLLLPLTTSGHYQKWLGCLGFHYSSAYRTRRLLLVIIRHASAHKEFSLICFRIRVTGTSLLQLCLGLYDRTRVSELIKTCSDGDLKLDRSTGFEIVLVLPVVVLYRPYTHAHTNTHTHTHTHTCLLYTSDAADE